MHTIKPSEEMAFLLLEVVSYHVGIECTKRATKL
jgi:hypothetical protein